MPETTTITLTGSEAALFNNMLASFLLFALIFYILTVIASWKILTKAGEKGWKALIPIYNVYVLYKIVKMQKWFWITLCASFVYGMILALNGYNPDTNKFSDNLTVGNTVAIGISTIVMMAIGLYVQITYAIRTSRAFGHGTAFAVGLFFFQNIFWLILGFGGSKYNKKYVAKLK